MTGMPDYMLMNKALFDCFKKGDRVSYETIDLNIEAIKICYEKQWMIDIMYRNPSGNES